MLFLEGKTYWGKPMAWRKKTGGLGLLIYL